jgi:hypothetical protein
MMPTIVPPILLAVGSAAVGRWLFVLRREDGLSGGAVGALPVNRMTYVTLVLAFLVATFWGLSLAANEMGRRSARMDDLEPDRLPLVTIFGTEFIDLPVAGQKFTEIVDNGERATATPGYAC